MVIRAGIDLACVSGPAAGRPCSHGRQSVSVVGGNAV